MTTATRKRTTKKAAPRKRAASTTGKPTDKQVREWAVASGIQGVQMRGRVSAHLVEEFHKAGGKPIEGASLTQPVQATGKPPIVPAPAPVVGSVLAQDRPSVYIVTGPTGERMVLKPDAVYVEEITIDDTSVERIIESLARLNDLPRSDAKVTLVRTLSGRLQELVGT